MRSREIYNFIHRELTVKQRKETISRGHIKEQVSRSTLCGTWGELLGVEGPMLMNYLVGVDNLSKVCPILDVGRQDP